MVSKIIRYKTCHEVVEYVWQNGALAPIQHLRESLQEDCSRYRVDFVNLDILLNLATRESAGPGDVAITLFRGEV